MISKELLRTTDTLSKKPQFSSPKNAWLLLLPGILISTDDTRTWMYPF
jgi:hypothetical protein